MYIVMRIKPLTYCPPPKCSECGGTIRGRASRDAEKRACHAECLLKRREVACD